MLEGTGLAVAREAQRQERPQVLRQVAENGAEHVVIVLQGVLSPGPTPGQPASAPTRPWLLRHRQRAEPSRAATEDRP